MIPLFVVFAIFFGFGLLLTGWPHLVRKFVTDACIQGRWGFWIGREMMLRRVKKADYVVELRLIGVVSLFGAAACVWALMSGG